MIRRTHQPIRPTCHRPLPPMLTVSGQIRQRIVDVIANWPDGITRGEILALVYAEDPNGGPNSPNTVSVLIARANEELAPQGYRIMPAWPGHGGKYRLERLTP